MTDRPPPRRNELASLRSDMAEAAKVLMRANATLAETTEQSRRTVAQAREALVRADEVLRKRT